MSSSEIVWFDGHGDPTFVIFRKGDDAHYFYWPYEVTLLKLKADDIEPVKVSNGIVLSRYHFFCLTVWVDPEQHNGKAVANFSLNFHTPLIVPRLANRHLEARRIELSSPPEVDLWEKAKYLAAIWLFELKVKTGRTAIRKPRPYASKLVMEIGQPIKENSYLFDAEYLRNFTLEVLIIGEKHAVDKTIEAISDPAHNITAERIIKLFGFR